MKSIRSGAAIAAVLGIAGCSWSGPAGPLVKERHTVERGTAERARVEIEMGAGDLEVKSGAAMLLEGDFEFNTPALKPVIAYKVDGSTGALTVSQESASGNYENNWRLSLDETTPMDLDISLGAGDAQLVLGRLNLSNLDIQLGAGDLVVDLRGMPAKSFRVKVQAGAGDTRIQLPAGVGLSVSTSGIIGDTSVSGLEKRDGRWVNSRAEGSPVTVDLEVQHAIGDLRIEAE